MLQQRRLYHVLQVDDTLLGVASASRLLDALKPSVGGLHPATDLAAYVHLLLPWHLAYSACRQVVTGVHTASKVPEYLSPVPQVCLYTPALLADGLALCRPFLRRGFCI